MPTPEKIPHEAQLRTFVNLEVQKTRAAKGDAVVASPTADVNSLKTAVDAIRAALTASGVTKP